MSAPLRLGLAGLGSMGRNHLRVISNHTDTVLAAVADPTPEALAAAVEQTGARGFADPLEMIATADLDGVVIAAPTTYHAAIALAAIERGLPVLVEKPLAATSAEARQIIDACERAGVPGAVGHVERFNPALLELRRRVREDQLGDVFLIATERVGPFPDRVRDVGVVKDLATHDLDLVRWLGGAPIERLAAQTQHRMGRPHEDLVLVTGALRSNVSFNVIVDWLSPTKVRRTRILGERGMLVADTLTADLTFYANGEVSSEWSSTQALRGVSEGDMTRYALSRREPLLAELDAFLDLLAGAGDPGVVTLQEGLETVVCAEAVLTSAADRRTVEIATAPGEAAAA